jgi:hypothetical protein
VTGRSGGWRIRGERALFEALRPRLEEAACRRERWRGFVELGRGASTRAHLKYSALSTWPALRHASRALVPWLEIPRLQELANLAWLRERGFGAPRPLVAGALRRAGLPRFQFLATEEIEGARTLADVLAPAAGAEPAERAAVLELLARDVARMHALGFVHRDLFARNVLVTTDGAAPSAVPRLHFLDAWRGGPRRGLRGFDYDLACFLVDGERLLSRAERERFEKRYAEERSLDGAAARALHRSTRRTLDRLARRLARRGRMHGS